MNQLAILPCLDNDEMAASRRRELSMPRHVAEALGRSAVEAADRGRYVAENGVEVIWKDAVEHAKSAKLSIPPELALPPGAGASFPGTIVQVSNDTTLAAGKRLVDRGLRPLALNFANGVNPGGGFLSGARAQEEALCRSSALYTTILGDPMYEYHRRPFPAGLDRLGDRISRCSCFSRGQRKGSGAAVAPELYYMRGSLCPWRGAARIRRLAATSNPSCARNRESLRLWFPGARRMGMRCVRERSCAHRKRFSFGTGRRLSRGVQ